MKQLVTIILVIFIGIKCYSQNLLSHGLENEFGFFYFENDNSYKRFIDSAYSGRDQLAVLYMNFSVKKKSLFSKNKKVIVATNNWILNRKYKGIPVSKIPNVIKLSKTEYKNLRYYIVDEDMYRKISKLERKTFYNNYIYPKSNILIREIDVKTKHAVMFRLMNEGIVLYQNELSGDIELPQQDYYWRSPLPEGNQ